MRLLALGSIDGLLNFLREISNMKLSKQTNKQTEISLKFAVQNGA
jgi:hypothetical protein